MQDVRHDKRTACHVRRLDVCSSVSASIVAQLQEEASDLGASVGKVVFKKSIAKLCAFFFVFSPAIASMTNLFECARRTDGGAACILASEAYLKETGRFDKSKSYVRVISGAEG